MKKPSSQSPESPREARSAAPRRAEAAEALSPLLTDLYQLTMACGYWKHGMDRREAVFDLFFRANPFQGGFAVACGLEEAVRFVEGFRFRRSELDWLADLRAADGAPLFEEAFLKRLSRLRFTGDIDAIPEGSPAFPHEPLLRVEGPLMECQLLETALLNLIGFSTLVATKAARVCLAAEGDPVLEFGLRRAQGPNGGLTASRAAYVGGCAGVSNVLAGMRYGIPVRGTHAHSWVLAFGDERQAFEAFARAMPHNCTLLVDTFDSIAGVRRAIQTAKRLRSEGVRLLGVRLDSGDLAWLSRQARRMLDEAGLQEAVIVASNDLDERAIAELKRQGAAINVWGVGTRLVTAYDQPALGCVYKLARIREPDGAWRECMKLSDETAKTSVPGRRQVRRFSLEGRYIADAIFDLSRPPPPRWRIVDPADPIRRKDIPPEAEGEDLLQPIFRRGERVWAAPPLDETRARTGRELQRLDPGILRFVNPNRYPAGLEESLFERRQRLIDCLRGGG